MTRSQRLPRLMSRPVTVSMLYGALLVGGVLGFMRVPLELAPAKEFPRLSVVTSWSSTKSFLKE